MRPAIALVLLLAIGTAHADTALDGDPLPSNPLEDPDFHVASSQFGLERRVEMYQWRRDEDGGYSTVWNAAPIDASSFDAPHRNPARLPVRNRQWWVESATLDGRPLPLGVIRLLGQWQAAKPNFSRLPSNFAARFQPEGDGLASSYNPLAPAIGDVRITWHEFVLPP
ncbi:MAG TPA: TMEM43 family protein, partial [Lysobacter sp.]|nr:TMEM43 family protein [Lysobacter sp.]